MIEIVSEIDLTNLIRDHIEENLQLEYKSSQGLSDNKEISKDVSAMANSAGGLIIYGINEKGHLPEIIDPVNRMSYSREKLEQVINSNIEPPIKELLIIPIEINNNSNLVVYVVKIPQSETAHQAKDGRYYKRNNFSNQFMHDFEIRDIMNRNKNPRVILEFDIINEKYKKDTYINTTFGTALPYRTDVSEFKLVIRPKNIGKAYARYISYNIEMPIDLINKKTIIEDDCFIRDGTKYYKKTDNNIIYFKNGGYFYKTLLPNLYGMEIIVPHIKYSKIDEREIFWSVYADNAESQNGKIKLSEIEVIEKQV